MSEDWINAYNEKVTKHNKRVTSIREVRLPKSCVKALDEAILVLSQVHESLIDGVVHGYHPLTLDDIVRLANTLHKLKSEFEPRELR